MSQVNNSIDQQSISQERGSPSRRAEGASGAAAASANDTFDKKLQEQDKIMADAQNVEEDQGGDDDLYDEHGNFD